MAMDMFIEIKGADGETKDSVFKGKKAIDVLAWSWGLSNSSSAQLGGGVGAGKANFQDLSFTHYVDTATSFLMMFCATGKVIDEIKLTCRKAGGTALEYIVITLNECMITSCSTGGSGGEDRITENVSLGFAKVKFDYQPQNDKGGKEGAVKTFTYDLKQNKK